MNRRELCACVADAASLSGTAADAPVSTVFSIVADALAAGETVAVAGFGAFGIKDRPARPSATPSIGARADDGAAGACPSTVRAALRARRAAARPSRRRVSQGR